MLGTRLPIYPFSCSSTHTVSEWDQIHAEMYRFFPFADEIRPQWVPEAGISVKSSSPGAKQPFLQGPAPLSDSSRRDKMVAMPAIAFDFFLSISPLISHWFIDRSQSSLCWSAKRVLQKYSICNMITQKRMVERWTDTNPLFPSVSSFVCDDSCASPPSGFPISRDRRCSSWH